MGSQRMKTHCSCSIPSEYLITCFKRTHAFTAVVLLIALHDSLEMKATSGPYSTK